jgi:REP element-mobilizing transposase RayT
MQRIKAEFTTYHIIQRGNERKNIFYCDADKYRYLDIVARTKEKYNFMIYCYCLMNNHVHLLVNDNGNDISKLMKSINVSYVSYFNKVYERCGHLFQDRFRSEIIDNDPYLLEVSRYIHNNPVKAGIVARPGEYRWSSYNAYVGKATMIKKLLDTNTILDIFSEQRNKAVMEYFRFMQNDEHDAADIRVIDIEEEKSNGQENKDYINGREAAMKSIEQRLSEKKLTMEELLQDKEQRNEMIKAIRKNSSLNLKELGDLFGGLSESRISRILRD